MGTVFQIPWTFIRDSNEMRCKREVIWPKQAIAELKKLGYKTAALALTDDSVSIDDPDLMQEEKLAVILASSDLKTLWVSRSIAPKVTVLDKSMKIQVVP